jgi:hypothetical protein
MIYVVHFFILMQNITHFSSENIFVCYDVMLILWKCTLFLHPIPHTPNLNWKRILIRYNFEKCKYNYNLEAAEITGITKLRCNQKECMK